MKRLFFALAFVLLLGAAVAERTMTAQGGGIYMVKVNGVERSRHSTLHKAREAATNAELAKPADTVTVEQALKKTVEASQVEPAPTPTPNNWRERSTAPGVIRALTLTERDISNSHPRSPSYLANYGIIPSGSPKGATAYVDPKRQALRFPIVPFAGGDSAGSFFTNFSPNLDVQIGENEEVYVQVQVMWDDVVHKTFFLDTSGQRQGGIKFFDLTLGDMPGGPNPDPYRKITHFYSSADGKLVVQGWYQYRFPMMYGYGPAGGDDGLHDRTGGDFIWQNAYTGGSGICSYNTRPQRDSLTGPAVPVHPGCMAMAPNEWVTFQLHLKLGPRKALANVDVWTQRQARLWMAREGQPSQLLIDFNPSTPGYYDHVALFGGDRRIPRSTDVKIGKVFLFPYMTAKSATQDHPVGAVWYRNLIISRNRIADPTTSPAPTPTPRPTRKPTSTPAPADLDKALIELPAGAALNLGKYTWTDTGGHRYGAAITDYSGLVYDRKRRQWVVFGGGHASTDYDAINRFRRASLRWEELYLPTPGSVMTPGNYDRKRGAWLAGPSGPYPRPVARHTADMQVVVGDELVILGHVEGNGAASETNGSWPAPYTSLALLSAARITHVNLNTGVASFSDEPAGICNIGDWGSAEYDSPSGKVIGFSQNSLCIYDPITRTKALRVIEFSRSPGADQIVDLNGARVSFGALFYNKTLVYYPPTQKHYFFVSNTTPIYPTTGSVFEIDLNRADFSKSIVRRVADAPLSNNRFAYDARNQVLGGGLQDGVWYVFDPRTRTWESRAVNGPSSIAFMAMDYSEEDNVYLILTPERDTWAYRWK